jgi:subtilisin family serine protease
MEEGLHESPPAEQGNAAGGCLAALIAGVVLIVVFVGGFIWLNLLSSKTLLYNGFVPAAYAVALIVVFGAGALFLRGERFAVWRGVSLALAVGGGQALVAGGLLTLDISLRWPGVPEFVWPVVTMICAGAGLLLARRTALGGAGAGRVWLGIAFGLFASIGWVAAGALGTLVETWIGLLDGLAAALMGAVFVTLPYTFDPEAPARRPFWAAMLSGAVFGALLPGLLAGRGYWLQGTALSLAMLPLGIAAGGIATLSTAEAAESPARGSFWRALAILLPAFLLPYLWTEGLEGDWMQDEMINAWARPVGAGVLIGAVLALAIVVVRGTLARSARRPALPAGLAAAALIAVGGVYVGLGQPGLMPDSFFVVMADQADTAGVADIADVRDRYQAVYDTLTQHALADQADLRAALDAQGAAYTPYYLVNGIEVQTFNPLLRGQIARRADVARVLNSPQARPLPSYVRPIDFITDAPHSPGDLSWGVDAIDAEVVWGEWGVTGEGVVVGLADSGVDWTHPALRPGYMGAEGDHNYTWFDPWFGATQPTDTGGHGTHTAGTVLGQGGIGVAPGAQWIACRNLARDLGNPGFYLDCMQFLFAPYPMDGDSLADGDPARGADVTNNSWGCPPEEGCDGLTLPIAVAHLRDAGQVFVASAGNKGPDCSTVGVPATADAALSVGAVSQGDNIAIFSSRGPILIDDSGRIKPDLTAPGVGVLSAKPGGGFGLLDGTSMAGPHVTGAVALLLSANSELIGDPDGVEALLFGTADFVPAPNLCGGGDAEHNNVYGYGVVDADEAVGRVEGE